MPVLLEPLASTVQDYDLHELEVLARREMLRQTFDARNGEYLAFLDRKAQLGMSYGFKPVWMPRFLFGFQKHLVDWALRKGRAAIFADCGLGKTPMQLVWAQNVVERTNRHVIIFTPPGVGHQTVEEGNKFGIPCRRSLEGDLPSSPCIVVTNYERLKNFNPADFEGVVCDESSILKNFEGTRKSDITEFMRTRPYRLLCTATAAPNDYIELGTSAEALGELGYMDMLGMFFRNEENSLHPDGWGKRAQWRLKPHGQADFWRWVCSWARCVRRPSDLGFDDTGYDLPPLTLRENLVRSRYAATTAPVTLQEQLADRRATIPARCRAVASMVADTNAPAVLWCHLNPEADLLESLIPGAKQVSGSDTDEQKERTFRAFSDGSLRVLITKPKIAGFGMNWQHCNHTTFFPSHSFEQFYQSVRRFWRFGQQREVFVDIATTAGEAGILRNLRRKHQQADAMFALIVQEMNNALAVARHTDGGSKVEIPSWLH